MCTNEKKREGKHGLIVGTTYYQTFPRPWTPESFVEVLLTLIQKTNDHELKTQICAVSKVLAAVFGLVSNAEPFHT